MTMTGSRGPSKSPANTDRRAKAKARSPSVDAALVQLREELETTQKEFESFCYSVSHDLRAPLRCVDGFSTALLHEFGEKLEPAAQEYLQRIVESSRKMAALIDELLVLSRIQRSELLVEDLPLSEMAQKAIERLRAAEPGRNVATSVQPNVQGRGDRRLIGVLLDRLIENAWKFTNRTPNALIEFSQVSRNGKRAFAVRDNGAGFNPAYSPKLFKLFQRLHAQADFPGIGGGLAIARAIVLRHRGATWAEGAVGQGATFYFTLEI